MRINRDQVKTSKLKDVAFAYNRGRGHMLAYIVNRFQWFNYPRLHIVPRYPLHLDIEISSLCNMKCPMCFTVTDDFKSGAMGKGFMKFELFKKIIDESARYGLYSIRISHRGEAFMHPEVVEFIRYAKSSGIKEVASLSNILALTPELFRRSMEAGLDWLTISFDGLGEAYEKIRMPAKFREAYEKVKAYKRLKEEGRSAKPVIKIQSVWPAVSGDVGAYIDAFSPYVDSIAFNPLIDYLHKDSPDKIEYFDPFDCPTPYQRLTVLFDGRVPYCHNDEFLTSIIGDANKDSIFDLWHGSLLSAVRAAHRENRGVRSLSACKHCFLPRKTEPVVERSDNKKIVVEKYKGRTERIGA